ncbi:hypothetical protein EJ04DRAFT_583752 [Polyplosphaeria fusca]|uniref:Uncharacterized protein n=1 Tax=Polyplosphaeria fusca TaxID=682080 RepID=A0A9P4UWU0_9PLEO|nr:hypothetical protein EJ04DRAFT_583752 [Polyplosphaeria fusca]
MARFKRTVLQYFLTGGVFAQSTFNTTTSTSTSSTGIPSWITGAPEPPPLIPPANIAPLPSQFSDIPESAVSCWDARANYTAASWFLFTELMSSATAIWTQWTTTSLSSRSYVNENYQCQTNPIGPVTTLCDGIPRLSAAVTSCGTVTSTYTEEKFGELNYYTPAWSTALDQLPSPTCTMAADFGKVCSRLYEAYDWRTSQLASPTPRPTREIMPPDCAVLSPPSPDADPICALEGGTLEAFYWPTPIPSGPDFCNPNATHPPATPTIPGKPNTAIVSGHTLTSPSIYYFVRNATLATFAGRATTLDTLPQLPTLAEHDTFRPSTTFPGPLTIALAPSALATITRFCSGSNRHRKCYRIVNPNFSAGDMLTVRSTAWSEARSHMDTIVQSEYRPVLAVPVTDVAGQNKGFGGCGAWSQTQASAKEVWSGPVVWTTGKVGGEDWSAVMATGTVGGGEGTAVPGTRTRGEGVVQTGRAGLV